MRRIAWVGISFLLTAACHGSCASSGGTHDDAGDAALDVGRDIDRGDAGDLPDVRPDAVDVEDASTDAGDADTTNDGGDADASVDPEMTVDPSNVTLAEGGMPATVSLTLLSRPTDAVTITPLAHSDIQATSITIQPMEWDQPHDLMIEAIDDVIAELTETHDFALEASSVDDTFDGQQVVVDAEVEDNDSPEILVNRTSTGSTWSSRRSRNHGRPTLLPPVSSSRPRTGISHRPWPWEPRTRAMSRNSTPPSI
jgi:hypothetical protein